MAETNQTHCARCGAEFGLFTWSHKCFKCGDEYCSKHLVEMPAAEAARRLGPVIPLHAFGVGLCSACDATRVTTVKDILRECFQEGDTVFVPARHWSEWILVDREFRVGALVQGERRCVAALVPTEPWDTSLWWLSGGEALSLVPPGEEAATVREFIELAAKHRPEILGRDGASQTRTLARRWRKADVEERVAWFSDSKSLMRRAERPAQLAQIALDLTRSAVDASNSSELVGSIAGGIVGGAAAAGTAHMLSRPGARTGHMAAGIGGLVGLAVMAMLHEDPPVLTLRTRIRALSHAKTLAEAQHQLEVAAIDLIRASTQAKGDDLSKAVAWRALGATLRWLATGSEGLLHEAASADRAHPLASAFGIARSRSLEHVDREIARRQGAETEFPWVAAFKAMRRAISNASDWSQRPLERLVREGRLGTGTYKDVYAIAGRPDAVLCVAKQGQDDAVRREVDILLMLATKVGEAGEMLGLQRIEAQGTYDLGDERRLAFVTARLDETRPVAAKALLAAARDVASTLRALHGLGLIHGDVKPANVMWNAKSRAVLIDYGGALEMSADRTARALHFTEGFAAPEVVSGESVGPAADVYAWGSTVAAWLGEAAEAPLRTDSARRHVALWAMLDKCNQPRPSARPTWVECLAILDGWLSHEDAPPTRLASIEAQAELDLAKLVGRWKLPMGTDGRAAVLLALRHERLPTSTDPPTHFGSVAKSWLEGAKTVVNQHLWIDWANTIRGTSGFGEFVDRLDRLVRELKTSKGRALADAPAQLRDLLKGRRGDVALSLSQSAVFLGNEQYERLRWSVIAWRNAQAPGWAPDPAVRLLGRLGRLRNALEHGVGDDVDRLYGHVEAGKVLLDAPAVRRVKRDVLDLIDVILLGGN